MTTIFTNKIYSYGNICLYVMPVAMLVTMTTELRHWLLCNVASVNTGYLSGKIAWCILQQQTFETM